MKIITIALPVSGNLKLDDDRVTTDPIEILDQLKLFYSDLYQDHSSNIDGDVAAIFLNNPSIPKLDEDKKGKCEGRLNYLHIMNVIARFSLFKIGKPLGMTV